MNTSCDFYPLYKIEFDARQRAEAERNIAIQEKNKAERERDELAARAERLALAMVAHPAELAALRAQNAALRAQNAALRDALAGLLARAQVALDQSATHDGLTNCDALARARTALEATP